MSEDEPGRGYLLGTERALAAEHDAALLDLDGVLYRGPRAVRHAPEVVEAVRGRGMRVVFVTNNANRRPGTVADQLTRLGVAATADDVLTSAQAAAAMLAAELEPGAAVLAVGGPGLRTALEELGLSVVSGADDGPVAVAQGYSPDVSWRELAEAAYAVRAGARFVATNLDATIPTDRGTAPGNGTLVAAVRTASGVDPRSAGKPEPGIFRQAASRAHSRRPVVVGDRLDTDIAGAVAAGMRALHVLTGVDDVGAVLGAPAKMRPDYVATDVRGLLERQPRPDRDVSGWWVCGGAACRITQDGRAALVRPAGGAVREVGAPGTSTVLGIDEYRALCCAAWSGADAGRPAPSFGEIRVDGTPEAGAS